MAQPFLALITPLSSGPVDPGYFPPGVGAPGSGAHPSHPIMLPGMPGWGSGGPPPVAGWPGGLPGGGGFPGQGGPVDPGYFPPGVGGPGSRPVDPGYGVDVGTGPVRPAHPIYIPPTGSPPPLGHWGPVDPGYGVDVDTGPVRPTHPIVLPPDLPPTTGEGGKITWKTAWTPQTGWIVIGIPAEGTLVPTPSSIGQSPTKGKP